MAEATLPHQQAARDIGTAGMGAPLYHRRPVPSVGPIELVPNRDFVFPQRPPNPESPSSGMPVGSSRRPASLQPPSRRIPNATVNQRRSASALPDFSFNPSGSANPALALPKMLTPPQSPDPTTPSTPRSIGHRRGGSEFIGGDGRAGGFGLMSSSPTKGDGVLPAPASDIRVGPPAGRRGHSHRRSGAISSHDVMSILQPRDPNGLPASAPVSPMDCDGKPFSTHTANRSLSHPSLRTSANEDAVPASESNPSQRRPPSRARVGFSDHVEYIRPLSTISSETESSMSTVRGHSVSNSLSSVISAGASSPQSRLPRPSLNTTFEDENTVPRPSTAGEILDVKDKRKNNLRGNLQTATRPMSAYLPTSPVSSSSSDSSVAPRHPHRSRWLLRPSQRRSAPELAPFLSSSEPSLALESASPIPSPSKLKTMEYVFAANDDEQSSDGKAERGPRKVKSWASAFMSLKPKHTNSKAKPVSQRPPTPPPPRAESPPKTELVFDLDNLDVDNTVTIVTPPATDEPARLRLQTDYSSWKPREVPPDPDAKSPVIDLDAALGPFNTPTAGPNPRGSHARGFGAARRQMYSGFTSASWTLNHRRTESAPELPPFELRVSKAIPSSSPMADVFEEEEEEDTEESPRANAGESQSSKAPSVSEGDEDGEEVRNIGIQVVESADLDESPGMNFNFDRESSTQEAKDQPSPSPAALSPGSPVQSENAVAPSQPSACSESSPVEVVEDYEEPRTSSLTRSSDSTATPTMPAEDAKQLEPPVGLSLPLPQQALMTPDTLNSSGFPSPRFPFSDPALDTPRLGTAASSLTDRGTVNSMVLGEPGLEALRISVDDVPSLTSSRSTMTSGLHHSMPVFSPRSIGDRSSSVSSITDQLSERRRKRSSIASLSRLVGGSFGERSKLSIEQRPQSEHAESPRELKQKKPKRFSRLRFWKSKEFTNN